MLAELDTACATGTKKNAQGYKISWKGYKLHLDTACCGIPISAVLTGANVHDSRVALPLTRISRLLKYWSDHTWQRTSTAQNGSVAISM